MAKVINGRSVVTNKARINYAHLVEPAEPMNGGDPVYSCCLVIPKDDTETVNAIKQAVKAAAEVGKDKVFNGKIPNNLKIPLRDGDDDRSDDENYKNCFFINAKSKYKPRIVDLNKRDINDPSQIYSGMYAKAVLSFYAYSAAGNKGIACSLGDMQKVEDGERIGGVVSADVAFGSEDEESMPF